MSTLSVRDVSVTIDRHLIVDSVSFDVPAGSWLSLIGPNGAGKSTILKALSGSLPHSGDVFIDNRNHNQIKRKERARLVAHMPQRTVVPDGMPVFDFVCLGRTPHMRYLGSERSSDIAVVRDLLDRLDLAELGDRLLGTLSGGELQRAVLAQALAQQAPILILDEPTAALDVGHQWSVLELVDKMRTECGLTVIAALHDLGLVGQFSDLVVLLNHGRVQASGTPRHVLTQTRLTALYNAPLKVDVDVAGRVSISPQRFTQSSTLIHPTHLRKHTMSDGKTSTDTPPELDPRPSKMTTAKSLILVNTGDGKGKSSAAFGTMLRALARDWKVGVIQFLKSGDWNTGEEKIGRQLGVDWWALGDGFTWDSENLDESTAIAQEAWRSAKTLIMAGNHQLIILDEITYPMNWKWIDTADVVATLQARPEKVSVILTGRDAPAELIAIADTATEMVKTKHAYDNGIVAKKGIDF